ncbi:cytochrome c oxidase VIIc family protein, partial [Mangrovimonas sp. AS18]
CIRHHLVPYHYNMSLIVRAPLRQLAVRRFAAVPSRGMHGEYKHIPFDYKNRAAFATKLTAYLATGFAIPFIAAFYQLSKSSGSS